MSLSGVSFSPVVDRELFWIPGIPGAAAWAVAAGDATSPSSLVPAAAAPATNPAPARNLRRSSTQDLGVISDDGISVPFLTSIYSPRLAWWRETTFRNSRCAPRFPLLINTDGTLLRIA